AWSYPNPDPGYESITDYLAFYPRRMDACWVGDDPVTPQPGLYYGGWGTPQLTGPVKGEPGAEAWERGGRDYTCAAMVGLVPGPLRRTTSPPPRTPPGPALVPAPSTRAALAVLQIAAIAVVLVALPLPRFELDRYTIPKELVVELAALAAGTLCLSSAR